MPLRIRIDVNGQDARTVWVGRVLGDATPDSEGTYIVGYGSGKNGELEPWNAPGASMATLDAFTHRYGDGMERCAERALEALRLAAEEE